MTQQELNDILSAHEEWLLDPSKGKRAVLRRASLRFRVFDGRRLSKADFSGADLSCSVFKGADASKARFYGACLDGASFSGADLSGADLGGTSLVHTNFSNANMNRARLADASVRHTLFYGADFGELGALLHYACFGPTPWARTAASVRIHEGGTVVETPLGHGAVDALLGVVKNQYSNEKRILDWYISVLNHVTTMEKLLRKPKET